MAQHFLLSPQSKTLSVVKVMRLSEVEARDIFKRIRWAETDGKPVCPKCGHDESYDLATRQVYKCKACHKQYSITSGTMFHGRKLAMRDILAAIALFVNGAKGYSALQLSRDLGVSYRCAFVLCHKMREAIGAARAGGALGGEVEVDGAYFGGYVKPANERKDRKDRRRKINTSGKRQVVVVARERGGETRVQVAQHEREGVAFVASQVAAGAVVHADEASHWDALAARYPIARINHKEAYSKDGACTNGAESFFSRMRRAEIGVHHHIAGGYLQAYAEELAWREDARRTSNGMQFLMVAGSSVVAGRSERMRGYWQQNA